jgi:predicted ferric reductase
MDAYKPSERTRDTLAPSGFTQQVGAILRFVQQQVGGEVIVGLAITNVVLWVLLRPPGVPGIMYVGEIFATTAIVLLSCSLVLATRAPLLERFFGGLDRMYLWHRWSAVAGVVLLPLHSALVTSAPDPYLNELGSVLGQVALLGLVLLLLWALAPRLSAVTRRIPTQVHRWFMQYQRWFTLHRLTGLFVVAGLVHGALVDPVLRRSTILLGWYVAVAAVGTAAYVYRELFLRFFSRRWQYDYTVKAINRLDPRALEVMLAPTARPLPFLAGQFVFVRFGGSSEWERHPFTVSSAPQERDLRLSIEALGDYTQYLSVTLQPGAPAIVSIAFGLFDYRQGTREQVWIAGGIGITPFRSWIRAFPTEQQMEFDIDLYYTVRSEDEALFLDEIRTAATQYPSFRPHISYSQRDGSLTMEHIVETSGGGTIVTKDVYMCGPSGMTESFQHSLRKLGVPPIHIHFEHFTFR